MENKEKEKVRLPGQTAAVSPATFRMIEIIENEYMDIDTEIEFELAEALFKRKMR